MSGAIVRELVTVLGFKTDLKGIKQSEQALLSFKTKVALAVTAAAAALAKTLDFFGDLAKDTLKTRDIADATGIALSNLLGMGKAAAKYGLEQQDINELLTTLNSLMRDALFGQGELYKLAAETGIQYKDNNGELLSNEEVLQNILSYLGSIENKQYQLAFASKLFGASLAGGVARISRDLKNFNQSAADFSSGISKNIEDNIKSFEDYDTALIKLKNSWSDFVTSLGLLAFPALSKLVDLLTWITDGLSKIVSYAPTAFKHIGESLNADLLDESPYSDYNQLKRFEQKTKDGTWTWSDFFFGVPPEPDMKPVTNATVNNTLSTKVDVQVPQGITEPQQVGQYVADMVNAQLEYTINQIYNNNPQVE